MAKKDKEVTDNVQPIELLSPPESLKLIDPRMMGPDQMLAVSKREGDQQRSLVRVLVTPQQASEDWESYLELCRAILDEGDYTYYLHYNDRDGKPQKAVAFTIKAEAEKKSEQMKKLGQLAVQIVARKKRSAWDKLARYFGLTTPRADFEQAEVNFQQLGPYIIETRVGSGYTLIIYQQTDTLKIVKATATVLVVAPGGRTAIGEAVCSVHERARGFDSFAHADHDIPTTALTRAMNRAISRCIGTGETSAEEMDASPSSESVPSQAPASENKAPEVKPASMVAAPNLNAQITARVIETPVPQPAAPPVAPPPAVPPATAPPPAETPSNGFKLLAEGTSLQERIRNMEAWVYGAPVPDNKRENQLVKYAFFIVPTPTKVDIEGKEGRFSKDKWQKVMMDIGSKEQRAERMTILEQHAQKGTPPSFKQWLSQMIEATWKLGKEAKA